MGTHAAAPLRGHLPSPPERRRSRPSQERHSFSAPAVLV